MAENPLVSLRYVEDLQKQDPSGRWRKGPTITKSDVVNGTGAIEHITVDEFFSREQPAAPTMGFGKYRDKEMTWVRENDPDYWQWALDELPHFARRAKSV